MGAAGEYNLVVEGDTSVVITPPSLAVSTAAGPFLSARFAQVRVCPFPYACRGMLLPIVLRVYSYWCSYCYVYRGTPLCGHVGLWREGRRRFT